MEKRIIPITLGNDKLRLIISEIIEPKNIFGNLEFQLTDKNDLHKNNKSILIADNDFVVKELSHAIKFDTIFIINCACALIRLVCIFEFWLVCFFIFRIANCFLMLFALFCI